jgi:hypothetical protein
LEFIVETSALLMSVNDVLCRHLSITRGIVAQGLPIILILMDALLRSQTFLAPVLRAEGQSYR